MKLICCLMLVVLGLVKPAAADHKIVLESFTGGKTESAAEQLRPLLEALANRGFIGGYDALGRVFEGRESRPAISKGLPADFADQVEKGFTAFVAGRFDEALKIVGPLVDAARVNGGAFATNQDARETYAKALIVLALSQQRRGDTSAASDAFGELLRSFPTMALSKGMYGGEAVSAFEQAKRELVAKGRGKLVVRSNVDTAVIFINEKIEAAGTVTKDNLLPGEYRVFAQLPGKQLSRSHRVMVKASETATVTIDAAFDQAVQTSPTWTGLSFATAAEREKSEVRNAAVFGSAVEASAVAVVGIDQVRGRPAIVGILVDRISGTEIRRASVALDPAPGDDRMNALAQFLAGENLAPAGIDIATTTPHRRDRGGSGPSEPETSSGFWGGWKFITGGLALAAIGTGAYLLKKDGDCKTTVAPGVVCPDIYNNAAPGWGAIAGGAVLTGVTLYLVIKGGKHPTRTAFVRPAQGGGVIGLVGRF